MADDLLPCPFCGGEAYLSDDASHSRAYFIGCKVDGCFGEIHWEQTKAEAIAAWNRRALPVAEPLCTWPSCGHTAKGQCRGLSPSPVAEALHRSFPEAGDGRPMPPMGDELMTAGLNAEDARFVAVQLAQNGLTLTPSPVDDSQSADPDTKVEAHP